MSNRSIDQERFISQIADQIGADYVLLRLALLAADDDNTERSTHARYQLHGAAELAQLRREYERHPAVWARRRWKRGAGHLGGGGAMAASGFTVSAYLGPNLPILTDAPTHAILSVLTTGIGGLGVAGGAVTAIVGAAYLVAPARVHRDTVWRRIVDAAATRAARGQRTPPPAASAPRASIAGVRQALDDLMVEWANYRLDTEAWYLSKPLLHDTTGTVAATVAYETALADLIDVVDGLNDNSTHQKIDEASAIADRAWDTWYAANEYAAELGVSDRTPTERAALQRLSKLVTRLTRATANDPEIPAITRDISACLDKITTVSVSWADIAALPAVESAAVQPQLGRS